MHRNLNAVETERHIHHGRHSWIIQQFPIGLWTARSTPSSRMPNINKHKDHDHVQDLHRLPISPTDTNDIVFDGMACSWELVHHITPQQMSSSRCLVLPVPRPHELAQRALCTGPCVLWTCTHCTTSYAFCFVWRLTLCCSPLLTMNTMLCNVLMIVRCSVKWDILWSLLVFSLALNSPILEAPFIL